MGQEIQQSSASALPVPAGNPFARSLPAHLAAGTVEIESQRAIAEAQGKLLVAKRFPRDEAAAYTRVMEACSRPSLARVAQYAFPRAGQTVSGPSIRLAEELARCWGNLDYGIRELSRKDGVSEMEAYAWDVETNVISSQKFTVRHIRDTRGGGKDLTDERDIYELTANMGGRRLRARILAILPPDLVEAAIEKCRATLAGKSDEPIADRIRRMAVAFSKVGVGPELIETRLGHKLDNTTPDELADLLGIYTSIKDGMTHAGEWFGARAGTPDASAAGAAILEQAKAGQKAATGEAVSAPPPARGKKGGEAKPAPPADQKDAPSKEPAPAATPTADASPSTTSPAGETSQGAAAPAQAATDSVSTPAATPASKGDLF